jgi:hypothetical protein
MALEDICAEFHLTGGNGVRHFAHNLRVYYKVENHPQREEIAHLIELSDAYLKSKSWREYIALAIAVKETYDSFQRRKPIPD